jgi:hypothetical protein
MATKENVSELIAVLGGGDFNIKCSDEMAKLVAAVEAGHGKGKISITIDVKKEGRVLVLKPKVKATIPVADVNSSMFFVSKEGHLTDEDPAQLPLAHVPQRTATIVALPPVKKPDVVDVPQQKQPENP